MNFNLKKGQRYKVYIKLSLDEIGFENTAIKMLGESVGLTNIEIWGGGSVRHATCTWGRESQTIDLPAQIRSVEELVE